MLPADVDPTDADSVSPRLVFSRIVSITAFLFPDKPSVSASLVADQFSNRTSAIFFFL
jgi:hypothetical protein